MIRSLIRLQAVAARSAHKIQACPAVARVAAVQRTAISLQRPFSSEPIDQEQWHKFSQSGLQAIKDGDLNLAKQHFESSMKVGICPSLAHYGLSLSNIGIVLRRGGRTQEAADTLRDALDQLVANKEGVSDVVFANIYRELAICCDTLKKYDDARDSYQKALDLYRAAPDQGAQYGKEIAYCLYNVAMTHHHQDRLQEALTMYKEALEQSKLAYGEKSRSVAEVHSSMGAVYLTLKEYNDAREHMYQAMVMFSDLDEKRRAVKAMSDYYGILQFTEMGYANPLPEDYAEEEKQKK